VINSWCSFKQSGRSLGLCFALMRSFLIITMCCFSVFSSLPFYFVRVWGSNSHRSQSISGLHRTILGSIFGKIYELLDGNYSTYFGKALSKEDGGPFEIKRTGRRNWIYLKGTPSVWNLFADLFARQSYGLHLSLKMLIDDGFIASRVITWRVKICGFL
jgi:hypothetical protein